VPPWFHELGTGNRQTMS